MNSVSIVLLTLTGIFSVFILTKKSKVASDYVLLLLNAVFAGTICCSIDWVRADISGLRLFLHFSFSFLLTSFYMLYAYSLIEGKGRLVVKWWFFSFSLPFLLFAISDLLIGARPTAGELENTLTNPSWGYHIFFKGHKVFVILVGFHILKQIKAFNQDIKDSFSNIDNVSAVWLRNITVLIMAMFAIHLITFLLYNVGLIAQIDLAYIITGALISVAILFMSYFGIRQYSFPAPVQELTAPVSTQQPASEPKASTPVSQEIFQQVIDLFENEKIYINPQLRIGHVAEKIGVPTHKVSVAINAQFGKPFYDLVAQYRTDLLKTLLADPANKAYTVLALASDAGFNSKASLNRIFKEQTNMTPTQYQRLIFQNEPST